MADAAVHPHASLALFLQGAVEQNPDPNNHPRLVLLRGDDRLGDQAEEVGALRAVVPELEVTYCGVTNDHYLRNPAHASAVVGGVILGSLLET